MPNTAVKPANAESTWGEAPWEDRKPLILVKKALEFSSAFFVVRSSWFVGADPARAARLECDVHDIHDG